MAKIINHNIPRRISSRHKIESLKSRVNIVAYIMQSMQLDDSSFEVQKTNGDDEYRCLCPFHDETEGSFSIYEENQQYYCYGCGTFGDVLDFVEARQPNVNNVNEAMAFLESTNALAAGAIVAVTPRTRSQLGPVRSEQIEAWHCQLIDRSWLYERLITDETIDQYQLGYWPQKKAITIPFWTGNIGASPVNVVQMRSLAPDTKRKYFGLTGFYGTAMYNQFLFNANSDYLVVLFGTFDALLALQDGIPAVSPNGANQYHADWTEPLQKFKRIYVVPDLGNESELKAAQLFADKVGKTARVRQFPDGNWGKDFSDWRLDGRSADDFMDFLLSSEHDGSF